jgi:hypothetical protein
MWNLHRLGSVRRLSSKANLKKTLDSNKPPNSQPFVKVRLQPGEQDPLTKVYPRRESNPLYRPRWRNKAQIISAEDFEARPKVTFEEEFASLHDGMVVLSWLSEEHRQDVYQMYLELMVEQEKEFKTTSHEYVMRVIGERFNLTPTRVAAIVQNCHDEIQVAKEGGLIHEKAAAYVDAKIKEHINNVYTAYGEVNPNEFVEEPTGVAGITFTTGEVTTVEDLYNVDELTEKAILREKGEAQKLIDTKIYIEDAHDDKVDSQVNAECLKLIKQVDSYAELKQVLKREDGVESQKPEGGSIKDDDGNIVAETERRTRWKYVAQTINVREQKKTGGKSRGGGKVRKSKKGQRSNTIVEQNGVLRVATVHEVANTAWKPQQNVNELCYKGVKTAWLNRMSGEKNGWGRVAPAAPTAPTPSEGKVVEESS